MLIMSDARLNTVHLIFTAVVFVQERTPISLNLAVHYEWEKAGRTTFHCQHNRAPPRRVELDLNQVLTHNSQSRASQPEAIFWQSLWTELKNINNKSFAIISGLTAFIMVHFTLYKGSDV